MGEPCHAVGLPTETAPQRVTVPGRVNLIGEHVDYHNLPCLPMAIQRKVTVSYRVLPEPRVDAQSASYPGFTVTLDPEPQTGPPGDWCNYILAAIRAVATCWPLRYGIDATVLSDLPPAAGLSSSTALLTAFAIALLRANGVEPTVAELMDVLPEGEQFVGTRGGGMDHAAVLASQLQSALLVEFAPLRLSPVPIPDTWGFLVAHSLQTAEKSGPARAHYNARREAGISACAKLGFSSFREALTSTLVKNSSSLTLLEERAFRHVVTEAGRVDQAVSALRNADASTFGKLLLASHASLRDDLEVSSPALDELVEQAMAAGALGARLTGAGFGGCAIIFSSREARAHIARELTQGFYASRPEFDPEKHLIFAEPSAGALS